MANTFEDVKNGDIAAFSKLYGNISEKIYRVAYYSLITPGEAVAAVKVAARYAYENAGSCRNKGELEELMLRKLCEQIVIRFREYRKSPPSNEQSPSRIKALMLRLTDAERLSVMVWSVFDYDVGKISSVTGLASEVVTKKLESGQNKLSANL